jgi:hypothetical protein
VSLFEIDGAEHCAVGVPPGRVVPSLDPVEHRQGELLARVPAVLVEQLELESPEETLAALLSKQSPIDPIEPSSPAARSRRPKAHDVYWDPWSECATVWPLGGHRRQMAICTASTTSSERM